MPRKRTTERTRKPAKIAWKNARLRHNGAGCRQCDALEYLPRYFGWEPEGFVRAGIDKTGYCRACRMVLARSAAVWVASDEYPCGAWPYDLSEDSREMILDEYRATADPHNAAQLAAC